MRRALVLLISAAILVASCGDDGSSDADSPTELTLVTHDSFAISEDVLAEFTAETGIEVEILPSGDAGAALNQSILTKGDPLGDVFFGVDNSFLTRATDAGIFVPYESAELANVPEEFQLDPTDELTPIDYGDVCINFDKAWFAESGLMTLPETLEDLTKPEFRDLLVVENPATSSPGLAFLLATIAEYGEDDWQDYWSRLRDNGVQVVDGWDEAFNGEFSGGEGGGDRPLVVSYASSPPVTVYFSDPPPSEAPIGTMLGSCFRQVEFAGILDGTEHEEAAGQFIDFMLSQRFQEDVPLNMFVFPVRDGVTLPQVFVDFADVPDDPYELPPNEIGEQRDTWIDEWTDTVLR